MLAHRLAESPGPPLPAEVEEEFRQVRTAATMRGIMIRRTLAAVDECLGSTGMRYVWLKGAALRSQVYPNPLLRPMVDLDVSVPADLLPVAAASVESIGFRDEGFVRMGELASGHPTARLVSKSFPRLPLEIHGVPHSLQELPDAFVEGMWERAVDLEGTAGLALSPADTLLHLCLHLSRHHRFALGVRPLLDIALSVSRWGDEIDWPRWCDDVRAVDASASVWLPLTLSAHVFRADIPEGVLDSLRPDSTADNLLALAKDQFEDTHELPGLLERLVGGRSPAARVGARASVSRVVRSLPNKILHYLTQIRFGQIPLRGWRKVTRLAKGRRRLSDTLRKMDEDRSA